MKDITSFIYESTFDWDRLANRGTWDEINSCVTKAYKKLGDKAFYKYFAEEDVEVDGDKVNSLRNAKKTCIMLKKLCAAEKIDIRP